MDEVELECFNLLQSLKQPFTKPTPPPPTRAPEIEPSKGEETRRRTRDPLAEKIEAWSRRSARDMERESTEGSHETLTVSTPSTLLPSSIEGGYHRDWSLGHEPHQEEVSRTPARASRSPSLDPYYAKAPRSPSSPRPSKLSAARRRPRSPVGASSSFHRRLTEQEEVDSRSLICENLPLGFRVSELKRYIYGSASAEITIQTSIENGICQAYLEFPTRRAAEIVQRLDGLVVKGHPISIFFVQNISPSLLPSPVPQPHRYDAGPSRSRDRSASPRLRYTSSRSALAEEDEVNSRTLIAENLAYGTQDHDIRRYLRVSGQCSIEFQRATDHSSARARLIFTTRQGAEVARKFDGLNLGGRRMSLRYFDPLPLAPPPPPPQPRRASHSSTYSSHRRNSSGAEQLATTNGFNPRRLFIPVLDHTITETDLTSFFSKFGTVVNAATRSSGTDGSTRFGFVSFGTPEETRNAIEASTGIYLGPRTISPTLARLEQPPNGSCKTLFLSNVDPTLTESQICDSFDRFGHRATASRIPLPQRYVPIAFLAFESVEQADRARLDMNGRTLGTHRLEVSFAKSEIGGLAALAAAPFPFQERHRDNGYASRRKGGSGGPN